MEGRLETMRDVGRLLWEQVASTGMDTSMACQVLAEALAFGLNEGDFAPDSMTQLVAARFDELHIAKHLGPVQ